MTALLNDTVCRHPVVNNSREYVPGWMVEACSFDSDEDLEHGIVSNCSVAAAFVAVAAFDFARLLVAVVILAWAFCSVFHTFLSFRQILSIVHRDSGFA